MSKQVRIVLSNSGGELGQVEVPAPEADEYINASSIIADTGPVGQLYQLLSALSVGDTITIEEI